MPAQGKPVPPAEASIMDLICCSCCVFILQESDSALKVTPEGCDEKLGHGHKEEMLSPQPAAGKGLSTLWHSQAGPPAGTSPIE